MLQDRIRYRKSVEIALRNYFAMWWWIHTPTHLKALFQRKSCRLRAVVCECTICSGRNVKNIIGYYFRQYTNEYKEAVPAQNIKRSRGAAMAEFSANMRNGNRMTWWVLIWVLKESMVTFFTMCVSEPGREVALKSTENIMHFLHWCNHSINSR